MRLFTLIAVAALAQQTAWPRERPPLPEAARPVAFPAYQLRTLPNGLQVLVVPHHEQPSVSFRVLFRAGAAQDPDGKPGVAAFVAGLLSAGTTTKSAEAIADLVESAGGVIGAGAGSDVSFVSGAVIRDKFDAVLDLVADVVQHPAFAAAEIERQRAQALSGLQVSYDDPAYIADIVINRLVYGFNPYGRPSDGTPQSVGAMTRDDLVQFHRAWFAPNNALVAIVGDLTADEAFAAVTRAFGAWPRRDVAAPVLSDPPDATRRIVVIDRPGAVQTEIRMGQIGIPRSSPDYDRVDLAMRILGGEGANRLFGALRTDRSLTYSASADMKAHKFAGHFVAQTSTRPSATGEALRLMQNEFWNLQKDRVDPRELRGAQDYVSGGFPLTIEAPGDIALQVLNYLFYGLELKDLVSYRDRVGRVTVDDIQRVADRYLRPDRLAIVLVGDANAFVDQLRAMGFSQFERIPVARLDLGAPDLIRK